MIIDRKFIIAAQNPVNGKNYTHIDSLLLCAKDKAVPAALKAYHEECIKLGCHATHTNSILLLIERVEKYQRDVESRVPDAVGDEVKRCIEGIGVE